MKKIISIIMLVTIMLTSVTSTAYAASNLLGDIDNDGKVTVDDARLALRYVVKLETPTKSQKNKADWDKDGSVKANDARMILRTAVGLEKTKTPKEATEKVVDHYENQLHERYTSYDAISKGCTYYICYSDGTKEKAIKTESPPVDLDHCEYCGKACTVSNGDFACAYGGCTRWVIDIDCPKCGVFVPAFTCHTCKK